MVRSEHYTFRLILDGDGNTVKTGIHNATNPVNEGEPDAENPTAPKGGMKNMLKLSALNSVKNQVAGYMTSNVETFTGSPHMQAQTNFAMGVGKNMLAFAVNPVLGAVSLAADAIANVTTYLHGKNREAVALEESRRRSGTFYDQSRSK